MCMGPCRGQSCAYFKLITIFLGTIIGKVVVQIELTYFGRSEKAILH